jgi:hypothetical protein
MADRFNLEFIEYRRRELERFLNRIVSHLVLRSASPLQTFLTAPTSEVSGFLSLFNILFRHLAPMPMPKLQTKKIKQGRKVLEGAGFFRFLAPAWRQ